MHSSKKSGKTRKIRLICIAADALFCLGWFGSAIASPAPSRGISSPSMISSARSTLAAGKSIAQPLHTRTALLDLRPPRASALPADHPGTGALAAAAFPSAIHQLDLGTEDRG